MGTMVHPRTLRDTVEVQHGTCDQCREQLSLTAPYRDDKAGEPRQGRNIGTSD